MSDNTILTGGTTARSVEFPVPSVPATVAVNGLSGVEVAPLLIDLGGTFVAVSDSDGNAVELSVSKPQRVINAPGRYRLDVPVTVSSASVHLNHPNTYDYD